MRVVTRAESIASIVSGRPGPVPAAGGSCAREERGRSAARRRVIVRRVRVKWPPFVRLGENVYDEILRASLSDALKMTICTWFPRARAGLTAAEPLALVRGNFFLCRGKRPLSHSPGPNQKCNHAEPDFQ